MQTTPTTTRPLLTASTTSSSRVNVSSLASVQHRASTTTSSSSTSSRYLSTQETNNGKKQRHTTVEQTQTINNKTSFKGDEKNSTISTTANIISSPDGERAGVKTPKYDTKTISVSPTVSIISENNATFVKPTSSSVPDQATIISSISNTILTATPQASSTQQLQSTVLGESEAARTEDVHFNQIDRTASNSE